MPELTGAKITTATKGGGWSNLATGKIHTLCIWNCDRLQDNIPVDQLTTQRVSNTCGGNNIMVKSYL